MSTLCNTLVALNLTLGVFCQPAEDKKEIVLPEDDGEVWAIKLPEPKPEPKAPEFPPVVITVEPPAPPPAPPPQPQKRPKKVEKKPPEPNPYEAAVRAVLVNQRPMVTSFSVIDNPDTQTAAPQMANVPSVNSGPLDLPSPHRQERYESEGVESGLPVDNSRVLTTDRYIPGIVETGYNSQLGSADGGEMIIQVSRDVFGYHGRNILIPKGSRLVCENTGPGKVGETRVGPICKRILFGGNRAEILQMNARVGDMQGRAGITGDVDDQFDKKYGTAFILAGVSTGVRIATAYAASNDENSPLGNIADKGSQELSQKLGDISASVIEQTVNLEPIVTIAQGARVQIRPAQDWYIQKIGG